MIREALVLRHGQAHDTSESGDFGRELTDTGKRNAQRTGVWLARAGLLPSYILSSSATRAKRTAEKCIKTAGLRGDTVHLDRRIYNASIEDLLLVLGEVPDDVNRLLVVGHNPGLSELIAWLAREPGPPNDPFYALRPGSLVRLGLSQPFSALGRSCADVLERIHASTLPESFPFPGLDGTEKRARPAYYYQQSSVVPFRYQDGRLEVLIVGSSKRKHWVIPKGIHDPGLSAQESAAKEAMEEAGVVGEVYTEPTGQYSYPKWDATCQVVVYPMRVTGILAESEWPERHRGRRWVSVTEAADTVRNDDVKRLILDLPDALARTPGN